MSNKVAIREAIFIIVLIVIMGVEPLYRDPLYKKSEEVILRLQNGMSTFTKDFYLFLSFIGAGPLYFLAFLVIFNWGGRGRAFYYISFLATCLWVMNTTKMAYSVPRPYMTNVNIIPYDCSHEWGNPSGHSLFSAGFFLFWCLDMFWTEEGRLHYTSNVLIYSTLVISLLMPLFIGLARIYVGVHTIDQVIYGW